MFGDQFFLFRCRAFQSRHVLSSADISKGDTDIAQEPWPLGAFDRRFAEEFAKRVHIETKKVTQIPVVDERARVKGGLLTRFRETIPWTHCQAVITAEDPVSHRFTKL